MNLDRDSNRSPSILIIVPPLDNHIYSTKTPKGPGSSLLARAIRPTTEAVRKEMEIGLKIKEVRIPNNHTLGQNICILPTWIKFHIRATASVSIKLSFYFTLKAYFFYFTHPFLQNTYINLSILPSILFK